MKNSIKIQSTFLLLCTILFIGCGETSSSDRSKYTAPTSSVDDALPSISSSDINSSQFCSAIPVKNVLGSSQALTDSNDLSTGLLKTSDNLLTLSKSLLNAGDSANNTYIEAMLALSDDILEMADKIGEMADKILVMSDNIGEMSERILETQRIQSKNLELTQKNILAAQKNFNEALQ